MTDAEAIRTVLQAAERDSSGHQHCRQILAAVARVRALLAIRKP